ncbi:glutathione S-transferase family protein [Microvirga pudoricolor]|uniref:glutathione S-transferase family protein n=1 Tax=Microvirga pudoricolor TaxID=2778729 RepID=UPI0019515E95|nr:glutathione S-transferase family protein [Microvirga pudoricolor]MBM6594534.1 glutathione S-transferase family protein [Microvirga pudoricolor]
MPTLVIANKIYSSWSLRPWLLLKQFDVAFDEILIPLDLPDTRAKVLEHSPAGKVPILIDGDATVWESLAIMDYAGENFGISVWPEGKKARAMARSVAAEMHSGFSALRNACPMNLGKSFARKDRGGAVARDVARFEEIVRQSRALADESGPFLFGSFTAADAMYAPLVTRLDTYSFDVSPQTRAYMDAILSLPAFREWREAALQESWIVDADEVDEEPVSIHRRAA